MIVQKIPDVKCWRCGLNAIYQTQPDLFGVYDICCLDCQAWVGRFYPNGYPIEPLGAAITKRLWCPLDL
jgi:hypothetical protein